MFQATIEVLDVYLINIATMKTTQLPNLLTSHGDYSIIQHSNEIYVISGYNYKNLLTPLVEKLSMSAGWKMCSNINIPRSNAAAVSVGIKIYVLGGNSGYKNFTIIDTIEEYDSTQNL